jgi:hypothetical protein
MQGPAREPALVQSGDASRLDIQKREEWHHIFNSIYVIIQDKL